METGKMPEQDMLGMVTTIAHELNNVLAVITTHCRFLRECVHDPQLKEDVEQIMGAAVAGEDLVKRIRDLAARRSAAPPAPDGDEPSCH
ncbi:MAG: histidine kinase dimerization/phospho-acceptor domain-containing protein [Deltaproteobacteria bacterium]|nr:histidine kinase dimerization/phospho-acceptor domain-containing protein [Deltaproteobacteria bacterium]